MPLLMLRGVRGFIPASRLDLEFVEDTEVFLNKPSPGAGYRG